MTPSQIRDRNPDWTTISAIGAAIATATSLLTSLGWQVLNPREQLTEYAATQAQVTARIESQIKDQSVRIDSLAISMQQVRALVQVKCIETRNQLIRQMLECRQ